MKLRKRVLKELSNAHKFRYVTYAYINTTLRVKYRRSYLGFFWTVLAPVLHYIIIGLVFTMLMGNSRPDYFAYYFSGALFFSLISGVLNRSTNSLVANEHFIKKIYVPKLTFVLNAVGIEFANFLFSGSALIFLAILTSQFNYSFYVVFSFIPLVFAAIALVGISCVLSVGTVYFRDFVAIVPVALQATFFATPVIYDEAMVPEKFRWLMDWNPLYYFLKAFRMPLLSESLPPIETYLIMLLISVLCLFLGLVTLIKFDNRIVFKL